MYGAQYDAFVRNQPSSTTSIDWTSKIQQMYWQAKQKYLSEVKKAEDSCIVLGDAKLDAKLETYRSIDTTSEKLAYLLDRYQDAIFKLANEQNSLGKTLKDCSKVDTTNAGKVMSIASKKITAMSHEQIKLYQPLSKMQQEMTTFHERAVDDTSITIKQMEDKRAKYRASLLWMKNVSEKLDPDSYEQLERFRKVQSEVKRQKAEFDSAKMDVVQKIDLLMASRCNLLNQSLGTYQSTLIETFEQNNNLLSEACELVQSEDTHEYEFKTLRELNGLPVSPTTSIKSSDSVEAVNRSGEDLNLNLELIVMSDDDDDVGDVCGVNNVCDTEEEVSAAGKRLAEDLALVELDDEVNADSNLNLELIVLEERGDGREEQAVRRRDNEAGVDSLMMT